MRPNVLLITSDQLRYDALACYGRWAAPWGLSHVIQTPNLSRLAKEGVIFAQAFSPNPLCVPARASITSGSYPHRCLVGSKAKRIADDQPKLAQLFADAGYATYAIGKLHYYPYAPPGSPRTLHGFQYAELHEEGRIVKKYDPTGQADGLEDYHDYLKSVGWTGYGRAHGLGNNDIHPAHLPLPAEHHEEAWVASRAIAAMERHRRENPYRPFFMWSSFSKPHSPYDPPAPYNHMYDPREIPPPAGDWDDERLLEGRDVELRSRRRVYGWDRYSEQAIQTVRALYAGMVSFHDVMVGQLLDWLEDRSLLEETILVYTSDHGDLLGDFGRFFKRCMFDGAVRIPMIWRLPGQGVPGHSGARDQMVGLQDILPTLCGLTGLDLPRPVDGMDLTPCLQDPGAPGRDEFVAYSADRRMGGHKAMLRTREWKYVYGELGGTEELYDVRRAEGELVNLAGNPRYTSLKATLRERLIAWCLEQGQRDLLSNGRLALRPVSELPAAEFSVERLGWRRY